jgi:succinyl-CoA synthetase alpha subunit
MDKPVIGFIAGVSAPVGRRMGHAGAIISGEADTAEAKMNRMEELGVHVVRNPADIGETVDKVLKQKTSPAHSSNKTGQGEPVES